MACNLINAAKGLKCKASMAGTGDRVFFFDKDAWLEDIVKAGAADSANSVLKGSGISSFPEPGEKGYYGCSVDKKESEKTAYEKNMDALFALLQNHLVYADIKTDSGQVTSEKAETNQSCSQVGTFVISDNIDDANELIHTLGFINFGVLIPVVGEQDTYYVVMSASKRTLISSNYDSGTSYDSDHGFTVTCTAAPAEYGVTKWKAPADLKTWAAANPDGSWDTYDHGHVAGATSTTDHNVPVTA